MNKTLVDCGFKPAPTYEKNGALEINEYVQKMGGLGLYEKIKILGGRFGDTVELGNKELFGRPKIVP